MCKHHEHAISIFSLAVGRESSGGNRSKQWKMTFISGKSLADQAVFSVPHDVRAFKNKELIMFWFLA